MRQLFNIQWRSITLGAMLFCAIYVIVLMVANLVANTGSTSFLTSGLLGAVLSLSPFIAAGYLTAIRAHPAGVFNSALVGIAAGVVAILGARVLFGEFPPAYASPRGMAGGLAGSLVLCALGGVLGTITRHYRG